MEFSGTTTVRQTVEVSDSEFLSKLGTILEDVYDFNPNNEYIQDGHLCYDVKYHTWTTEKRRKITESDQMVKEIFLGIAEHFKERR